MLRWLVALLLAVTALTGCSGAAPAPEPDVRTVSATEASRLVENGAVLIDVRTPEEFASGHLEGARNLDVQSDAFRDEVGELDRDASYVVYCRSGARAGAAAETMLAVGFADVVNAGGFEDLAAAGLPADGP